MAVAAALATTPSAADSARTAVILDVPFVSQSEALCGGAAAAMVLRYWGHRGVAAEDFASLVEPAAGGIRTGRLVADLEARGLVALPFAGTEVLLRHHLDAGRPVIALIQDRPGQYHYVVLVGWSSGAVVLHDPARAPFQTLSGGQFDAAWAPTGRWSLLLLPATASLPAVGEAADTAAVALPVGPPSTFAALVAEGVQLGRAGDLAAAQRRLQVAATLWPDSAAAWRELAGVRFRERRWSAAAALAVRAARLDPTDAHAWRLLGASRYLERRPDSALAAWNRVAEPRLDLVRIDGLERTRFAVLADGLGLESGSLLTARSLRRARRRLADLPAVQASRLDFRPLPGGLAQVDVAVVERPRFLGGPVGALGVGARGLADRELEGSLSSPSGSGEVWTASYRWQAGRPRARVAVSGPRVAGLPGVVTVEGFHERQTYAGARVLGVAGAGRALPQGTDSTSAGTVREVRRRVGLSWHEWLGADLRCQTDLGLERWQGHGSRFLSVGLALDLRRFGEALSLRSQGALWAALGRDRSFAIGTVDAVWRSALQGSRHTRIEARAGYRAAAAGAPPALWPGAGTGYGRADLLRAHPLLDGGVVAGPAFGTRLWTAGLEVDHRPWRLGFLQAGLACFVDAARAGGPWVAPGLVDAGAGLRLSGLGPDGELAFDLGRGLRDRATALSLTWRTRRTRGRPSSARGGSPARGVPGEGPGLPLPRRSRGCRERCGGGQARFARHLGGECPAGAVHP